MWEVSNSTALADKQLWEKDTSSQMISAVFKLSITFPTVVLGGFVETEIETELALWKNR